MNAYDELMSFQRETEALGKVMGRLGWDQETVMPAGAAEQRAEEMAAMDSVLHARRTDPRIGDWLDQAEPDGDVAKAQVETISRNYRKTQKVPADLSAALARLTSRSQHIWAEARATEDVAAFLPTLTEVVNLTREKASATAEGDVLYDALLDDYEPNATVDTVSAMFDALRPRLVALREKILGSGKSVPRLVGEYSEAAQLDISSQLALAFGYSMEHGRIDKAVHPFSSGSGLDVRITTRTSLDDPFNCFYSTIHEVGHASYEQNIDHTYLLTPLGQGVSMGVHESQSRIYENQIGRGEAFTGWLYSKMRDSFGDFGIADPGTFYATVNRVHPGYIRTEADEVHYNLHVLLRFDLERALISGALEVADLEEAWNERFRQDFGQAVDKPSNGLLQDVHWSAGLFGYFPTYTLGNVYAGCLHKALRRDVSDLDLALSQGNTKPATDWLKENVQRHGGLRRPADTIAHATGEAPTEAPLLDYLEAKFGAIYGL